MTPRCGIDTSILVRLLTGKPEQLYAPCVSALRTPIEGQGAAPSHDHFLGRWVG